MAKGQGDLLFVVQSGGKQSKREKQLIDTKKRAHAARHSRKPHVSSKKQYSDHHTLKPGQDDHDFPTLSNASAVSIQRFPVLPSFHALIATHPESFDLDSSATVRQNANESRYQWSPLGYLGQSRVDPFQSTVIGRLPVILQHYLDIAQTTVWPSIAPKLQRSTGEPSWWRQVVDLEPHMGDTQIANAATVALRSENLEPAMASIMARHRHFHRNRAIEWINTEIANASGPPPWQVISMLAALLMHSGDARPERYTRYPETPIARTQLADVSGVSFPSQVDQRFLWKLIDLIGGIEAIALPLLTSALVYLDVMLATKEGTRPMLPFRLPDPPDSSNLSRTELSLLSHQKGILPLGSDFTSIDHPSLLHALSTCCLATQLLEDYRLRKSADFNTRCIFLVRMEAQHMLLSLLPSIQDPRPLSNSLHIVQAAALLYSDLVLFALPRNAGVRPRLLNQLRLLFENHFVDYPAAVPCMDVGVEQQRSLHHPPSRLPSVVQTPFQNRLKPCILLWSLTIAAIGAITARDDVNLAYFVINIAEQNRGTQFSALTTPWDVIKEFMPRYLWYEYCLEPPGRDVWEMVRMQALRMG